MADLLTGSDGQVAIAGVAADTVDTAAEFAALTWVVVGFVESIGPYGDKAADVTGNVINEGRTRHAKGTRDAGTQDIVCFVKADDAGQIAFKAAEATSNRYGIRITPRDRLTGAGTDSIAYYRGLVQSANKGALSANEPQRITFTVGIDSAIVEVAAT